MTLKHPLVLRPFVLVALASALAASALGAILLLRIQLALGPVEPIWIQVHGQAQVFGFLVPLVLGFGTYLVPRIAGGRPIRSAFARPALAGLALAALLAFVAPLSPGAAGAVLRRALALLVASGTLAGAICLQAPLEAGGARVHERLLQVSLAFLVIGGLADAAAWWVAEGELPAALASAAWRLAVEGFAIGMALAVSARMFSGFLGIEPAASYSPAGRAGASRERAFVTASWVWAASVLMGAVSAVFDFPRFERIADILFAGGIIPLSLRLGLATTSGGPAIDRTRDPLFPYGVRAAYGLLVAGAALGAAAAAADLVGLTAHSFWLDARRHLLNIGFLLTLIATMAGRLAPGFAGRPLALPRLRVFATGGFAAAAVLRALEGVAGQWGPAGLLFLSALSGPLAAAAVLALALSLGATLLGGTPRAG